MQEDTRKKEIYTYQASWPIYAMNWSVRPQQEFRLALGSFLEDYTNKGPPPQITRHHPLWNVTNLVCAVSVIQLNDSTGEFVQTGEFKVIISFPLADGCSSSSVVALVVVMVRMCGAAALVPRNKDYVDPRPRGRQGRPSGHHRRLPAPLGGPGERRGQAEVPSQ